MLHVTLTHLPVLGVYSDSNLRNHVTSLASFPSHPSNNRTKGPGNCWGLSLSGSKAPDITLPGALAWKRGSHMQEFLLLCLPPGPRGLTSILILLSLGAPAQVRGRGGQVAVGPGMLWSHSGLSLRAQAPGSPLVSLPGWLVFIGLVKMAITD